MDEIAEFYITHGKRGYKLRNALENDKEYQELLRNKLKVLSKKSNTTKLEREKYVLSSDSDFEILRKCKSLERKNLSKTDRELVKLIKTQLEEDWRKPLIKVLNNLTRKYK